MPAENKEESQHKETITIIDRKRFSREEVFLAGASIEGSLKVLPSDKWGLHYPQGADTRNENLQALLEGRIKPEDAADILKPDILLFNVSDLENDGLESVSARIRDVSSHLKTYDFERFAQFVSDLQGTEATVDTAQALYDAIALNRSRKVMMDAYGRTGQIQIRRAIQDETEKLTKVISQLPRLQKVLETLKVNWAKDARIVEEEKLHEVISQLSGEERELVKTFRDSYTEYVEKGSEMSYQDIVEKLKKDIPKIQKKEEEIHDEPSESMQELQQELDQFMDQVSPPGMEGDPGIPPEDQEECPPFPPPSISQEGQEIEEAEPTIVFFEILPKGSSKGPLLGFYATGRKSHFDINRKVWIKKKQEKPYSRAITGDVRWSISTTVTSGVKAIPVPNGYAIDGSSMQFSGVKPEIFRDQNGCFYVHTNGTSVFSIDFLKEDSLFIGPPVSEDTQALYAGELSNETEEFIKRLTGNSIKKAQKVQQYILANHFYPGGGNLQVAKALQSKLKQSPSETYIQTLDKSEYLECYSANTLLAAILRKGGIPTRLQTGHQVEKANNGKAVINSTTGHAVAEVWDGSKWRRIDATPDPKPEDMKDAKKDSQSDSTPTQDAEDDGLQKPQDQQKKEKQEEGEESQQKKQADGKGDQEDGRQTTPDGKSINQASNQDVEKAEQELKNAEKTVEERQENQQKLSEKILESDNFEKLKKLKEEIKKADVFEDMKENLEDKINAKEEQMKEELKKKIDEMTDEGFLDEDRRDQLEESIDNTDLEMLDKIGEQIQRESALYNEYEDIKEEISPLVDEWFDYFAERLPKEQEVETDEDSLTRQGAFNRHSIMRPRNLIFGTVKNPRIIKPSIKPKFLASVVVDVSPSMALDSTLTKENLTKITSARKLLVFYNELFSRISNEYGYIRYSNNIFSGEVIEIKTYDQEYDSPKRYGWEDGSFSTVKVRLMESVHTRGRSGTDMLPAIRKAAIDLNKEVAKSTDYASALYFVGDGEDTSGNSERIKDFLRMTDAEGGFGDHMLSAIMLGDETLRQKLAGIFGDDNTTVAQNLDELIEQSMNKFDEDISKYLENKTI